MPRCVYVPELVPVALFKDEKYVNVNKTSDIEMNEDKMYHDEVGAGVPVGVYAEGDFRTNGQVHAVHNVLEMVPVLPGVPFVGIEMVFVVAMVKSMTLSSLSRMLVSAQKEMGMKWA